MLSDPVAKCPSLVRKTTMPSFRQPDQPASSANIRYMAHSKPYRRSSGRICLPHSSPGALVILVGFFACRGFGGRPIFFFLGP